MAKLFSSVSLSFYPEELHAIDQAARTSGLSRHKFLKTAIAAGMPVLRARANAAGKPDSHLPEAV